MIPIIFLIFAKKKNFNTKITLAGRNTNDSMTQIVIDNIRRHIKSKKIEKKKILICGLTYKKNVADIRNSLSLKIFDKIKKNNIKGYDPLIDNRTSKKLGLVNKKEEFEKFNVYVILTKHTILEKYLKKLKNKIIINPI